MILAFYNCFTDEYHTSTRIFPRLNLTGMAFKDIEWDYTKDQVLRLYVI